MWTGTGAQCFGDLGWGLVMAMMGDGSYGSSGAINGVACMGGTWEREGNWVLEV